MKPLLNKLLMGIRLVLSSIYDTLFSIPAALVAASAILSPVLLLYAYAARKTKDILTQPS